MRWPCIWSTLSWTGMSCPLCCPAIWCLRPKCRTAIEDRAWTGHAITSTSTFREGGHTFWPGQTERGFVSTRIYYIDGRTPQWRTQKDQEHPDTFEDTLLIVGLDFYIVDDDWWTFIYSQIDFLLDSVPFILGMVFTRVGLYWTTFWSKQPIKCTFLFRGYFSKAPLILLLTNHFIIIDSYPELREVILMSKNKNIGPNINNKDYYYTNKEASIIFKLYWNMKWEGEWYLHTQRHTVQILYLSKWMYIFIRKLQYTQTHTIHPHNAFYGFVPLDSVWWPINKNIERATASGHGWCTWAATKYRLLE